MLFLGGQPLSTHRDGVSTTFAEGGTSGMIADSNASGRGLNMISCHLRPFVFIHYQTRVFLLFKGHY